MANGLRVMENRHLPILHKEILLCALGVSNEPYPLGGEWVVNIVWSVDY